MSTRKRKSNGRTVTWTLARGVGLTLAVALALATADTSAKRGRTFEIQGIPATGLNDVCGAPIGTLTLQLPPPLPPDFHGAFVGEFDPSKGATDAIPLTPNKCNDKDILLATTLPRGFLSLFGVPDPDLRLLNMPLRDVPIAGFDGIRQEIPPMGAIPPAPGPLQMTRSEPNSPITLGDWLSAQGSMHIQCFPDGTAHVEAEFHKLLPNRLYSLDAIWLTPLPGTTNPTLVPVPFGGVPNAFMTDEAGFARFERALNLCPMDPTPDGSVILFLAVYWHSDGEPGGGALFRALDIATFRDSDGSLFTSTLPPGTVSHVQIHIPITVKPLR